MAAVNIRPLSPAALTEAARIIKDGGLVAFPTETYYGLAADPFSESALVRLFALKKRPAEKPLPTLIAAPEQLARVTEGIPAVFQMLMHHFWPGPLTLIFEARPELSAWLTGGSGTVGARISSLAAARRLAAEGGGIITATSANRSGLPPAVTAQEAAAQLGPGPDLILDGGSTPGGRPSTILAMAGGRPVLLREGAVSAADLQRRLSEHFPGLLL